MLLLLAGLAHAGSISTAGVAAGPDSGPATADAAAIVYNPAAIAPIGGFTGMFDLQYSFIRIDATTTRNDGIDPNTGEPYAVATARVQVPEAIVGVTWQAIEDRLTVGVAANDPFVGGGDYTSTETGSVPPYTGHQRYHGINTKVITASVIPAVGVTVVDGFHVGAGFSWTKDMISVLQTSDPLGTEGVGADELGADVPSNPYALDTYLAGDASGSHIGWNAGLFFNKYEKLQLGASYSSAGTFDTSGTGSVTVPEALSGTPGGTEIPAVVAVSMPLPAVVRAGLTSKLNEKLTVGAQAEWQLWGHCCNGEEGDIDIQITNEAGEAIGPGEGLPITIDAQQYSPRRLWDAVDVAAIGGFQANDKLWAGGRVGYNLHAVPDYAVSPTNLDFDSITLMGGLRYTMADKYTLGLAYSKFLIMERVITDSAWDLRDGNERFSPEYPFKASTNGTYSAASDAIGVRFAVEL